MNEQLLGTTENDRILVNAFMASYHDYRADRFTKEDAHDRASQFLRNAFDGMRFGGQDRIQAVINLIDRRMLP